LNSGLPFFNEGPNAFGEVQLRGAPSKHFSLCNWFSRLLVSGSFGSVFGARTLRSGSAPTGPPASSRDDADPRFRCSSLRL